VGKYTERIKLAATEDYCRGRLGLRATAKRHGVNVESLRRWAAAYRRHGVAGVQRRRRRLYGVESKIAVLQRLRHENLSYRQAAAIFNIRNFNVIKTWEQAYETGGVAALVPHKPVGRRKMNKPKPTEFRPEQPGGNSDPSRQQLLDELAKLRMENAYLKKLEALTQARGQSPPGKKS
jgi:transposase